MGSGTNGAFLRKGLQNLLKGTLEWDSGTSQVWSATLIDLSAWTAVTAITNASNNGSGLIRVTATSHGLSTGDHLHITQCGGVPNADGTWVGTVIDANTIDLDDSTFAGIYTSGGYVIPLDVVEFLNDITAAAVEETVGLVEASFTNLLGVLDADDVTFSAASGNPCDAVVITRNDTPAGTNDQLLLIITEGTNLPVTLNGGDVDVTWSNGASKIAQL